MSTVPLIEMLERPDLKPWPNAHPDIRLIVLRPIPGAGDKETVKVVGWLKKGSNEIVNYDGMPQPGEEFKAGDHVDSVDTFEQFMGGATVQKQSVH